MSHKLCRFLNLAGLTWLRPNHLNGYNEQVECLVLLVLRRRPRSQGPAAPRQEVPRGRGIRVSSCSTHLGLLSSALVAY